MIDKKGIKDFIVNDLSTFCYSKGITKVIIGLSGGIDSTLVACLATEAFGKENVIGISMPSGFSSQHSIDDAAELAKNLGIQYECIPIINLYNQYVKDLPCLKQWNIANENIQARIRANILMSYSNSISCSIVLTTGNKSEVLMGYYTLFGDSAGGYNPICDLYKSQVYSIANLYKSIIPENIFIKPPSAELRLGQTDSESMPEYQILDPILEELSINKHDYKKIADLNKVSIKLVFDIKQRIDKNQYKLKFCSLGTKLPDDILIW